MQLCFDRNKQLKQYIEEQWKMKRDRLRNIGYISIMEWESQGQEVVNWIDQSQNFELYHK